jgi:hypothetical protein
MSTEAKDLRFPMQDETMLSRDEVLMGLRDGCIAPGPVARARAFAEVTVVQRMLVEVINFTEVEPC